MTNIKGNQMTDIIYLKNGVYRVLGRQVGFGLFKISEMASSLILPWLVAGGFARVPAEQVGQPQNLALVQDVDPTLTSIQQTFRRNGDMLTNFRPVRWIKNAYLFVDGKICNILNLFDGFLNNRFGAIPGYFFIKNYVPVIGNLFGNLEHAYKQIKNFSIIGPLWQHTVHPLLQKYVFHNDLAILAGSYVAPYADVILTYFDKRIENFLKSVQLASGVTSSILSFLTNFSLQGLAKAFLGWSLAPQAIPVQFNSTNHYVIGALKASTAEVEIMAENHIDLFTNASTYIIDKWTIADAFAEQAVTYASDAFTFGSGIVLNMLKDANRFGQCLISTDRGMMNCAQSAWHHTVSDYLMPVYHFAQGYGLNDVLKFLSPVTGPVVNSLSYFYECVSIGNAGYINEPVLNVSNSTVLLTNLTNMLNPTTPVNASARNISGLVSCSLDAGQHIATDYVFPAIGWGLNIGYEGVSMACSFAFKNGLKPAANKLAEVVGQTIAEHPYAAIGFGLYVGARGTIEIYKKINTLNLVVAPHNDSLPRKAVRLLTGF